MSGRRTESYVAAVAGVAMIVVYGMPLLWMLLASLKTTQELIANPAGLLFEPTFAAYQAILNQDLLDAAAASVRIATSVTVLVLLIGTPAAYALARHRRFVIAAVVTFLVMLQIVPQTNTLIPLFKVFAGWGLLGSQVSVILADTALLLPFAVLLLRPSFDGVPREIEEAAMVDGANQIVSFVRVSLPVARNGLMTVAAFVFIVSWGEFLYAITLLTDPSQYPLSGALSLQIGQYGIAWDRLLSMAVVISLPVLLVFVLARRYLTEGLSVGAAK